MELGNGIITGDEIHEAYVKSKKQDYKIPKIVIIDICFNVQTRLSELSGNMNLSAGI